MALGTGSLNQVRNILAGTVSFTASAGVTALYVECIGAGQSGAGAASAQQSGDGALGGSAGGYSAFCVSSSLLAAGGSCQGDVGSATGSLGGAGANGLIRVWEFI